MKGITPVIAIVLLLMITIALIGFAYVWFNRMALGLTGNIEQQTNRTTTQMGEKILITSCVSGDKGKIYIKNVGTSNLDQSKIDVYVDGALRGACNTSGSLAPQSTAQCVDTDIPSNAKVKLVTGGGAFDEIVCP